MDIQLDPSGYYAPLPDVQQARLLAACGLLPYFFACAAASGAKDAESVHKAMEKEYGFPAPTIEKQGMEVDDYGVYRYTGDDPLYPLLMVHAEGVTFYVYPHGILTIQDSSSTIVTRMELWP